ncbi:connexin 27.5 [Plakobranchus ocellatus]|uniref:Connexin 27.5 n=1 Tax=Plakobranchus ocellatus TaxID=259542 RepID=A0AAV4AFI6_9GAST|nr:connexin 27.5 [Plakobranchus ocellatus]
MTELVLRFMQYILPIINNFNTVFQTDEAKIGCVLPEMDRLLGKFLIKFVQMRHVKAADELMNLNFHNKDLQHGDDMIAIGLDTREVLQDLDVDPGTAKKFFQGFRGFYEAVVDKMLGKFPFDDPTLPHLAVLDPSKTET